MSANAVGALLEWLIWGMGILMVVALLVAAAEAVDVRLLRRRLRAGEHGPACPDCGRPGGGHYPGCPRLRMAARGGAR